MNILLYYILPFMVVLGFLIFFHELGHFLVAKYFGVKVLKFSLGFGYKLLGKKVGDTEYLISAIPLGGYVKMLGEDDDEDESIKPEEEKRAFHNQHVLKRIAIVAAGPIFNMILALLLFCGVFLISGDYVITPEVGLVRPDSPAEKAGLQKGDLIISVEDKIINSWLEIKAIIKDKAGKPVLITVKRSEKILNFEIIPEAAVEKNLFGEEIQTALIGIVSSGNYKNLKLNPFDAVERAFFKTGEIIKLTFLTIIKLFQRVVPLKTLGGPILIGQMTGQLAQESFAYLIPFMAVISINLAILNLLPIPILDGGVIVFLLLELILGKPLSIKKREMAQKIGLSLLLALMVVVFYFDILRVFEK